MRHLIVLNGAGIEEASQPGQFRRCVMNVSLHEAAHVLPLLGPLPDFPADAETVQLYRQKVTAEMQEAQPEPGSSTDPHDWRFARRCCHLFYRACALDFDIPLHCLIAAPGWRSDAEYYFSLLLPEAIRMRHESFAAIENSVPPAALLDLWQVDLARYTWMKG